MLVSPSSNGFIAHARFRVSSGAAGPGPGRARAEGAEGSATGLGGVRDFGRSYIPSGTQVYRSHT